MNGRENGRKAPYYIVAPPYSRFSAGIKALHELCHRLNLLEVPSYLLIHTDFQLQWRLDVTRPDLLTPILTQHVAREHYNRGVAPIFIYPEIIEGNPYRALSVVRYYLNYPGLLGGQLSPKTGELVYSYSRSISEKTEFPDNILFIPVSDPTVFYPPSNNSSRKGSCFYAHKYKNIHQGVLYDITNNSLEITSEEYGSHTQEELAEIFRNSEVFYAYENTSLALDAALCGCPTVFLPNPYLTELIACDELGEDAFAWGSAEAEIQRAKHTVGNVIERFNLAQDKLNSDIYLFIQKTQNQFWNAIYNEENYLKLLPYLLPAGDLLTKRTHTGANGHDYAPIFMRLPWRIEREIGLLLCRLGLKNDGEYLWNRSFWRSKRYK